MKHSNLNRSASPQTHALSRQHGPYKELQSENRQFSFGLSSFPHYKPLLSPHSTYFPLFFSFSMKTHLLLFLCFSFLMRAACSALFLLLTVPALYNYGSFYLLRQRAPTPPPPPPERPCLPMPNVTPSVKAFGEQPSRNQKTEMKREGQRREMW